MLKRLAVLTCICVCCLASTVVNNPTKYNVTFKAGWQTETITVTVNRPVNMERISSRWLVEDAGADFNGDGVVNFKDFAVYAGSQIGE